MSERRSSDVDANTQFALPLIDPLEPRVLPQDRGAWFTVTRIARDGSMKQRPYRLPLFETVLRAIGPALDTYLSQGTFAQPCRRAVHLAWMTHAYVDLDTYKASAWSIHVDRDTYGTNKGCPAPDEMVREILGHCDDNDIPPPSIILSSGRGFYCKWFWSQPIPRAEVGRAVAVNRALARRLTRFQADPRAIDVSRILRVAGTINSKNGRLVDIVWLNGPTGAPTTYDFDAFAREILPAHHADDDPDGLLHPSLVDARRNMTAKDAIAFKFNREDWHWGTLEDIRWLAASRYPNGIVQPGARDLYGHLAACQIARVIMAGPLFHEIVAIGRTFLPSGYVDGDLRAHSSTLLRRAMNAADGELVTFGNHKRTPIYTYRKTKLIELLEITPDEERSMTRLISDAEKERRRTERRRAAGEVERAEYKARAAARRPTVRAMRAEGKSWAQIAAAHGISREEARRLAKT